ncbi:MAG TPA: peptidoglycan bridge formation protein FemAB, partial [Arenibaculum sp.]|nr:peptidoglycan bridge formation protein FemAB [Arenibaculum sp.]
EAAMAALDRHALALAGRLGVDYVEYRCARPADGGWQVRGDLYAGFRRRIAPETETNLRAIPRKQRAVVRKSLGN